MIASLGGGGALVFGLSGYLGKRWVDRALEKEKNRYAEMLQNAQSELDKATNRYQVQLNTLEHIHQLRTKEEFSRLGQLWKNMAVLKDKFNLSCGTGLRVELADKALREQHRNMLRREYEMAASQAYQFFLEEKLFVPIHVAACAEMTLQNSLKEVHFHALFADDPDPATRLFYSKEVGGCLNGFDRGMEELEKLMRDHISGMRIELQTDRA
jgi:hypothetical protein